MDSWIQWAITTVVGILGLLIGRSWEKYDNRVKKDQKTLQKLLEILPTRSDALFFLRDHDFGDSFQRESVKPLWRLSELCREPDFFFINRDLEKLRKVLQTDLNDFLEKLSTNTFVSNMNEDYSYLPPPEELLERRIRFLRQQEEEITEDLIADIERRIEENFSHKRSMLNDISSSVYNTYSKLVSLSHKKL